MAGTVFQEHRGPPWEISATISRHSRLERLKAAADLRIIVGSNRASGWKGRIAQVALMGLFAGAMYGQAHTPADALRSGFAQPPGVAKLRCYWWWLNGNTTEETITRDLTEMSRKGFGGVLLVDADGSDQQGNASTPRGPTFGSPEWVRLYLFALKTAATLHLEVTLNATSGWNLGGPDVTPAQASKLLTWSRTAVGEDGFNGQLPEPPVVNGFYREIAVLAYPLANGDPLPGRPQSHRAPIKALRFKTASVESGFSMPPSEPLLEDSPSVDGEADTRLQDVIDLSGRTNANGQTTFRPPAKGEWEILRIGYTDSGARVSTSSGAWQGLAIDYLDRDAFDAYWTHTLVPLLEASRPYLKTTLVALATDSWELGGTNWTGRFATEFFKRRGYDPVRYLPVVAGRIVEDRATSDRFLNDLRRTVGDLITDHYDHFAERASEYGLGTRCESGGPHGAPVDALETFRSSEVPQTEFWAQSTKHRSSDDERFFVKEVASAANIYGKAIAADEGLTSMGPQWSESLAADLKPTFDQAVTEGMNRLVWHQFTSIPKEAGLPGNEYFAGTHINPNVTWWMQSDAFFLYLNRVQFLMQQGYAVNDVLYFYGDQVPDFVRLKRDDPAHVLPGYDYDVTNEDALLHALSIRSGAIASQAGNKYRILVLPASHRLSLPALERIAEYVRQGGVIVGPPPIGATGIVDDKTSARSEALTKELWGACSTGLRSYGAGQVFCDSDARAALRALQVEPDFEDTSGSLDYVHRRDGLRDIYFVRNTSSHPVESISGFRVIGRQPELWNAIDGSLQPQAYFKVASGITRIPLRLAPYSSIFVIFDRPSGLHVSQVMKGDKEVDSVGVISCDNHPCALEYADAGEYTLRLSDGTAVKAVEPEVTSVDLPVTQWTVSFQQNRGAPDGLLNVPGLTSWSKWPDPRERYFSGTATYHTVFYAKPAAEDRVMLVLTELHEICTVRINGRPAGTIWAMPYQLDVTDNVREGKNSLELEVTNLWPNRIIGDARAPTQHAFTHTNIRKYTSKSPLLPSGLIGPVTIETIHAAGMRAISVAADKP